MCLCVESPASREVPFSRANTSPGMTSTFKRPFLHHRFLNAHRQAMFVPGNAFAPVCAPVSLFIYILLLICGATGVLEPGQPDGATQPVHPPDQFDVVTLAFSPSCVAPHSIKGLNDHFSIRTIHVITTSYEKCKVFVTLAKNINCHVDNDVIPGVNFHQVQQHLSQRFASDPTSQKVAVERTGWYLQQIIKLGVSFAIQGLTDYFMIWDLDMVPMRKFPVFYQSDDARGVLQTRADISSVRIREYEASYHKLFDRRAEYPKPSMSFVAHWAMIYKPYMLEMLDKISRPGAPLSWPWVILDSVYTGERNVYYGFSEYTTYISWVLQNKPGTVRVMPEKDWVRVGPKKHEWLKSIGYSKCCPDESVLAQARTQSWAYFGWELGGGHSPECAEELSVVRF